MEDITTILPLARKTADSYGMYCGLDDDEAFSILGMELVEYAHDYVILFAEGNHGIIVNRFKRVLRQHARADKIRRLAEECENRYDPQYVRLFLPFYFDRCDWTNGPADDSGGPRKPGWRTTDAVDTALDIDRAFPYLTPSQQSVIKSRHLTGAGVNADGDDVDWQAVADELGYATDDAARKAYMRATFQLAVNMTEGKRQRTMEHQGPGSRSAISNAAANALIGSTETNN